ncbi:PadR family transcriptional regulator [Pseudonocardia saturnea]
MNSPRENRFRGRPRHPRFDTATPPFAAPADGEGDGPHRRGGLRARRHGGPRFGPGFGPGGPRGGPFPGGPFAGGPFAGGRGRRGGRRTSRGDIRAAVLALLAEQPRHGYEIIQEIAERSGGAWRPSPGSVYPTISQLEDEGLAVVEKTDGRRVVSLTEAGTAWVAEHREELDAVWEQVGRSADEWADGEAGALWEQLGQLHAAAQQVMGAGTPEQVTAATAALTEARKTIYRLLAE